MIKIIKLQSSQLEVEIIPELGGRVQKLLNKKIILTGFGRMKICKFQL
jgi:hypothetical protein